MSPQAIAQYRIIGKLGEGGMGVVYRATDTKLGRDVAVKVIPETFAQDADRMGRLDKRLLKLIRAFLNAGVMENGLVSPSVEGTPQGGPLSPLLSNLVTG